SPGSALRRKRGRRDADEPLLLPGRELHHAVQVIPMNRGEDSAVHAEIRVAHVLASNGIAHPEREAAEIVGAHAGATCCSCFFSWRHRLTAVLRSSAHPPVRRDCLDSSNRGRRGTYRPPRWL